jgi:hypothetical protein
MSDQHYYRVIGQDFGPVTQSALQLLIRGGQLGTDAEVRCGADGEWKVVGECSELAPPAGNDSPVLEEISDLSEIDAGYSGDSHVLSGSTVIARGNSGTSLSKSTIEIDEEKTWFCQVLGEEFGPLAMPDVRRMVEADELSAADLVRSEDQTVWAPASMLLGALFPDASVDDLFASAPRSSTSTGSPARPTRTARSKRATKSAAAGDVELADSVKIVDAATVVARQPKAARPASAAKAQVAASPSASPPASATTDQLGEKARTPALQAPTKVDSPECQKSTPLPRETQASAPPAQGPPSAAHTMNALAAAKLAKARASKPKMGGGLSMPDIPIEGLLKLVGVVALCAAVYFVYTLLPSSGNLPATYARLVEIYKEHEQLPDEGAERDQFVTNAIEEVDRLRAPLNESMSASNLAGLELNFTAGALLVVLDAADEDELDGARTNFLRQVEASHDALTESGVDASELPTIDQE